MAIQKTTNNNTTAKMMPHSIEAEQSVLGSVLIDNSAAINILASLKEEDFYVEAHKIIFNGMFNVYKGNYPVDFVTLTDELDKNNLLESVGGLDYITFLTNFVPSASNFSHYVDIILRSSTLRKLIHASNQVIEFAYTNPNKTEALTFAEKAIFDISQEQDKSNLIHIKEALPEVLDKFEIIAKDKDSLKGLATGFYGLDKITNGLQKSDLILIAARPGFGKTSLAMNIVNYAAINKKAKCALFALEMPKVQLAQRSLCSVAYVSMERALKGELTMDEWKALWVANDKLSKSNIYVDDSSLNTPVEILSKCRRLKAEHGLDLVMIDYLQLMNAGGKPRDNRQQEISEISRSLKVMARELNVPVIVLSQLSRAVETRSGHKPVLSDLRESGAIEQDADIVMFIHREDMYNDTVEAANPNQGIVAELLIAKHRNGSLGSVKMLWLPETTTFTNLPKDSNSISLEKLAPKVNTSKVKEEDLPKIAPIEETDITDIF